MRLFDKYLISVVDQRIPMPSDWQESLKLKMVGASQVQLPAEEDGKDITLHGYNFQQSDVLNRGYISNEVRTYDFKSSQDLRYLLQLYLRAIKDHTGKDYMSYFPISTTVSSSDSLLVTTTAPVILGQTYSFYAPTHYPVKIEIYLQDVIPEPIYTRTYNTLSPIEPIVLSTQRDWLNFKLSWQASEQDYSYAEEFAIFKIVADTPVVILPGRFSPLYVKGVSNPHKLNIPSAAYSGALYSNKLIPSLLGINCPSNPPEELVEQILTRLGETALEQAIPKHTKGIYDIDENIGGKLQW